MTKIEAIRKLVEIEGIAQKIGDDFADTIPSGGISKITETCYLIRQYIWRNIAREE